MENRQPYPGSYDSGSFNNYQPETRQQSPTGYDAYPRGNSTFNYPTNQNGQFTDQYGNYYYNNTNANTQGTLQARGGTSTAQPRSYDQSAVAARTKAPADNTTIKHFPPGQTGYIIQVASYQQDDNAERQAFNLQQQGVEYLYIKEDVNKDGSILYRLVIGVFPDFARAQQYLYHIQTQFLLDGVVAKLK
jgi:cell division protein FtsN